MAKSRPAATPSPETRHHVLSAIQRTSEPVTVAEIAKLLVAPHKPTTAGLTGLLDELVTSGELQSVPPKTAKGKPRYWDRDVRELERARLAVLRDRILQAIQSSPAPVAAKDVAKSLSGPEKFTEAELAPLLDGLVTESRLRAFAPATTRGKTTYWDRDLVEYGCLLISAALGKKSPQSQTELRKAAKVLIEADFQAACQRLSEARVLFEYPAVAKAKSRLVGNCPPSPDSYLRDLGIELNRTVEQLVAAGVPREELRRALVELVEATGVPFGSAGTRPTDSSKSTAVDLVALMRRIEPAADNGALVAARELRRAANLDKSTFDRTVIDLARQGRLMLHRHDFASGLTATERDELVTDGAGTYYVGMAIRRDVRE
jgi:hypothetical protein